MDYDVSRPVQLYLKYKGKSLIEGFLYFKKEDFKLGEFKPDKTSFTSDFILRLNKENNRTLSLKQVGSSKQKSLLTTKELFSTTKTPALNRLKLVTEKYETTIFVEEALHRLVEVYYKLGLEDEAKKAAAILGYNYKSGDWYKRSYKVFNKKYKPKKIIKKKKMGLIRRKIKNLFE